MQTNDSTYVTNIAEKPTIENLFSGILSPRIKNTRQAENTAIMTVVIIFIAKTIFIPPTSIALTCQFVPVKHFFYFSKVISSENGSFTTLVFML
jgi:hypothetical protein